MTSRRSIPLVVLLAGVLSAAAAALFLGTSGFPVPDGDAICFLPAAARSASGYGLTNPWCGTDPLGLGRLVWHGWLGTQVLGLLATPPVYDAILFWQSVTAALVLVLTAAFLWLAARRAGGASATACLLTGAFAWNVLPLLLTGRPEPFATLVVLVVALALVGVNSSWWWIVAGTGTGVLAVTHPFAAVVSATGLAAILAWRHPPRPCMVALAGAMGVATATATVILLFWSPFPAQDWLQGLTAHAQAHTRSTPAPLLHYWFVEPHSLGSGVWPLAAAGLGTWAASRQWHRMGWRAGFCVAAAASALLIWRFVLIGAERAYNLTPYLPVLCVLVCLLYDRWRQDDAAHPQSNRQRGARIVLVAVLLLSGINGIRLGAKALGSRGSSVTRDAARRALLAALVTGDVAISPGLFTLTSPGHEPEIAGPLGLARADRVMLQQAHRGSAAPPSLPGFRLVDNRFGPAPALLGIRVGRTPLGYNFAVYERVHAR